MKQKKYITFPSNEMLPHQCLMSTQFTVSPLSEQPIKAEYTQITWKGNVYPATYHEK